MGLIKAATGAIGGLLADQWREYFYCDAMSDDVLAVKASKRTTGRSTNTKGNENIISNGSIIAVADKQCMLIVEQGKVVEVCAEPGEFVWDSSTEPSIFAGSLGESIINSFKTIGKRFTFGGDTAKDQRVYYINVNEIKENLYGTPSPVAFRVVDTRADIDVDFDIRVNGSYSFRIYDPVLFYTNVCRNFAENEYNRSVILGTLKNELVNALGPALSKLSELELRPSMIPAHTPELTDHLNEVLSQKWKDLRGIEVVTMNMNPPTLTPEDSQRLKDIQSLSNPNKAAAALTGATARSMGDAASNPNGAMAGFMGMGMAMNTGAGQAANLFAMGQQQQQQPVQPVQPAPQPATPAPNSWTCACGTVTSGNFCTNCGTAKPSADGWTCSCGTVNKGKFCSNCGGKKPEGAPLYKCDKCGWEPEDPHNPPKFCPECGDAFDDKDVQ